MLEKKSSSIQSHIRKPDAMERQNKMYNSETVTAPFKKVNMVTTMVCFCLLLALTTGGRMVPPQQVVGPKIVNLEVSDGVGLDIEVGDQVRLEETGQDPGAAIV